MRLEAPVRKKQMLLAAMRLARSCGYRNVTRQDIAKSVHCSVSLVSYHFGDCAQLYSALMGEAVSEQDLKILAQGLIAGDPIALSAPSKLKFRALRSVAI